MERLALAAGVPGRAIQAAAGLAVRNHSDLFTELCTHSHIFEHLLHGAVARRLGLSCLDRIDPAALLVDAADPGTIAADLPSAHVRLPNGRTALLLAPHPSRLAALLDVGPLSMDEAGRTVLAPARLLRAALITRASEARLNAAINTLIETQPNASASVKLNGWQGWIIGVLVASWPWLYLWRPESSVLGLHMAFSAFFLSCVALRAFAAASRTPCVLRPIRPFCRGRLPGYTVMVALHRESEVAAQLVAALKALKWPPSRLDILLVCEASDPETMAALEAAGLPPHMRIVAVPDGGPRTKPKALMYALPLVRTPYLVLYDAEDRPHPDQLLEAWQAMSADPAIACVQAPLDIANARDSLLARLFAVEYAALFRGLLPFLARRGLYVPLGGTSNHFDVAKLRACGGWDPYNVTEDADIGLRLHAAGHRVGVITRPTLEDAPDTVQVWMKQRSRWMKGFLQTWCVALRRPRALLQAIGLPSFVTVNVLLGGVYLSALSHPVMLGTALWQAALLASEKSLTTARELLLVLDATSVAAAYCAFIILAWTTLNFRERLGFWKVAALTPLYWLAMSWAAWRALWQFLVQPHLWEKTPHKPSVGVQHQS